MDPLLKNIDEIVTPPESEPTPPPESEPTPPPDIELPEVFPGAVYRLFNTDTGVHLYTADVAERDSIIQNLSNYNYEGVAYFTAQSDGGVPVYRFYEPNLDIYLYTASEAERDFILDNLPNHTLQGESFTVFESEVEGTVPVYRFFIPDSGAFFYTANEAERDAVESLPNYTFEGVAFYGFASESGTSPDPEPTPDPIIDPDPDPDLETPVSDLEDISGSQSLDGILETTDTPFTDGVTRAFSDDYLLNGISPGQQVAVGMESEEFDTYLEVFSIDSNNGVSLVTSNDDIEGTLNSALSFTVESDLNYVITAGGFSDTDLGVYTLTTDIL